MVSERASAVSMTAAIALAEQAAILRNRGRTIIDLAQGEAEDLFPPEHVKAAADQAMRDNRTRYTAPGGIAELRDAIAMRLALDNGIHVDRTQVMAATGAKQCIFNMMLVALNPGDEVLIPAPYWLSYRNQVYLAGGTPVVVPTGPATGFKVNRDLIRQHLSPRTRVLLLNNPNNPSGAVYSRQELLEILALVLEAKLLVLADEVADRLIFDGVEHVSFAALSPEAAARTVTVNSVSKTYSMTGWRLGYAAGPREIIAAMERVQSHSTSCPNTLAQWAAVAALTGDQSCVAALRAELDARRRFAVSRLQAMPALACDLPGGSFFACPEIINGESGAAFAAALLAATGVMLLPGEDFGIPGRLRICFAASRAALAAGMDRMDSWLRGRAEEIAVTRR